MEKYLMANEEYVVVRGEGNFLAWSYKNETDKATVTGGVIAPAVGVTLKLTVAPYKDKKVDMVSFRIVGYPGIFESRMETFLKNTKPVRSFSSIN